MEVLCFLEVIGKPVTVKEISEETGLALDKIRTALRVGRRGRLVESIWLNNKIGIKGTSYTAYKISDVPYAKKRTLKIIAEYHERKRIEHENAINT